MAPHGLVRLAAHRPAPSLDGATGWLNTDPLTRTRLDGNVVLYVFWTYTCINWLRTLPYVRAWATKYHGHRLTVLGVHTPEFTFEEEPDNVARAVRAQNVGFPVVLDSDYAIWRSFDNHYWPALYLADHRGVLRYEHFGEGRYPNTERAIQQLLKEAGVADLADDVVQPEARDIEAQADWDDLTSPETYLGPARGPRRDVTTSDGWIEHPDRIVTVRSGAGISVPFHARDLNLVMKPTEARRPVRFQVSVDGAAPGPSHGVDIDPAGVGTLADARMYQLIRQVGPIYDRTTDISFPDGGAELFVVTFG